MSSNLDNHWKEKWMAELKDLGISFDENASKEEIKALLDKAKGKTPKVNAPVSTNEEAKATIEANVKAELDEFRRLVVSMKTQMDALAKNQSNEGHALQNYQWVPEGDEIEPIVYYMAAPTTNVWGKIIAGVMTPPPMGKFVKFKESYGWVTREGGTGIQQRRISTYICTSKTMSKWIESLPEFGRSIHRNLDKAITQTANGDFVALYNKHFASLSNTAYHDVMRIAKEMGCATNITNDHASYSAFIAEKRALQEMEANRSRFNQAIRSKGVQEMIQNVS
jgi:hypothetical protein